MKALARFRRGRRGMDHPRRGELGFELRQARGLGVRVYQSEEPSSGPIAIAEDMVVELGAGHPEEHVVTFTEWNLFASYGFEGQRALGALLRIGWVDRGAGFAPDSNARHKV